MVHVTNGADVDVRLGTCEFSFAIFKLRKDCLNNQNVPPPQNGRHSAKLWCPWRNRTATSPLPRECSTTEPHGQKYRFTCNKPIWAGVGESNSSL